MYNPLKAETIERISRDQTSRPPTTKQVTLAYVKAHLYFAATTCRDQDAREQLRILANITEEAHDNYLAVMS